MTTRDMSSPGRPRFSERPARRLERPDIRGKIEDAEGAIDYEVLEVRNGNALIWTERSHPRLPRTASGGFGWVEPLGRSMAEQVDNGLLRSRIESQLRSTLKKSQFKKSLGCLNAA